MHVSIRIKIFLVILLANSLVTFGIYMASTRGFDRRFLNYINDVQTQMMQPLTQAMAQEYERYGNWDRLLQDRRLWGEMLRQHMESLKESGYRRLPLGGDLKPKPGDKRRNPKRTLILKDAQGTVIHGNLRDNDRVTWLPIESNGEQIGSLGVQLPKQLINELDVIFASQQRRDFRWVALGMLLISGLVAIPFSALLVRPIQRLTHATRELTEGQFDVELSATSNDELGQLARDFNQLARTLKDNQQARQQWVADISHELRTPIAVVRAEIEAMIDGIRPTNPDHLNSLHSEVGRLSSLVDDLHELSLSDLGALNYRMAKVDLTEVLGQSLAHFEAGFSQQGIELSTSLPSTEVMIKADEQRLTQLFNNLYQNTLKYTQSPGQCQVQLVLEAEQARIIWQDSSPGVPESSLDKLFDRLYRVEESRNRATGGSGLGLAICQNIVAAHQGTVTAMASELGGLTIQIELPLVTG